MQVLGAFALLIAFVSFFYGIAEGSYKFLAFSILLLMGALFIGMSAEKEHYDALAPCKNYGVVEMQRSDKALIVCENGEQKLVKRFP